MVSRDLRLLQPKVFISQKCLVLSVVSVLFGVVLEVGNGVEVAQERDDCAAFDRLDVGLFHFSCPRVDAIIAAELLGEASVEEF